MTTTTPITTPTTSTAMRPPQAPAGQPILVAQGLTKAYQGNTVLHGVDLQIREGEFIAVMGPSGSGKSTLLYTISGMDRMTSGSVQFAGEELADLSQKQLSRLRLTRMGFIFQHVYLLKNLTLLDNVVLPAFLAKLAPAQSWPAARSLLERTGVGDLADRDISQASGGQLQRIGICRALINRPAIIFGDEPTGALDSASSSEIMDLLGELAAEGTTLMIVTHDTKVAARADRLLYLVDGRIVGDRDNGRYDGTGLERRHAEIIDWLMDRGSSSPAPRPR